MVNLMSLLKGTVNGDHPTASTHSIDEAILGTIIEASETGAEATEIDQDLNHDDDVRAIEAASGVGSSDKGNEPSRSNGNCLIATTSPLSMGYAAPSDDEISMGLLSEGQTEQTDDTESPRRVRRDRGNSGGGSMASRGSHRLHDSRSSFTDALHHTRDSIKEASGIPVSFTRMDEWKDKIDDGSRHSSISGLNPRMSIGNTHQPAPSDKSLGSLPSKMVVVNYLSVCSIILPGGKTLLCCPSNKFIWTILIVLPCQLRFRCRRSSSERDCFQCCLLAVLLDVRLRLGVVLSRGCIGRGPRLFRYECPLYPGGGSDPHQATQVRAQRSQQYLLGATMEPFLYHSHGLRSVRTDLDVLCHFCVDAREPSTGPLGS